MTVLAWTARGGPVDRGSGSNLALRVALLDALRLRGRAGLLQ
jgi:hypothetical protein